jgi:sulfonate transport system substrate-binding protein
MTSPRAPRPLARPLLGTVLEMRTLPLLTALTCTTAALGGGCRGGEPPAPAGDGRHPPLVIKFSEPGNSGLMAFARKDGRLVRELGRVNATIEWVPAAGAFSANFEAMNTGAINASGAAISPIIGALAHNLQFKIFAISDRPPSRNDGIIVPRGSPIRSVKDLVGKRVAVNAAAHGDYMLLRALERAGVPAAQVERVPIQPPEAAAAFATGRMDAWSTFNVFFTTAIRNGARVLVHEADLQSDDVGVTAASVALLEKHPVAFQVFIKVLQELTAEANRTPEKFQNVFTDRGPTALRGDILAAAIEETRLLRPPRVPTAADLRRVANVAAIFHAHGSIDRPVRAEDVVFDLDAAVRALGPLSARTTP